MKNVIISKQPEETENLIKLFEIVNKKNINILFACADKGLVKTNSYIFTNRVSIEKDLYFDFLWPKSEIKISENTINNNSIVCKLNYKDFSMLFTGDIEKEAEKEILELYTSNISILKATLLKLAHHGSNTSTTEKFLEAVNPEFVFIGVGKNNQFGHPNKEVLNRLDGIRK